MGVFDETYSDYRESESGGIRGPQDIEATSGEVLSASFGLLHREGRSSSSRVSREPHIKERRETFAKLTGRQGRFDVLSELEPRQRARYEQLIDTGEVRRDPSGELVPSRLASGWFQQNPSAFKMLMDLRDLEKTNPGALLTDEQISAKVAAELAPLRARDKAILKRSRGFVSGAAEFLGAAGASLTDPLVISTAPIGLGTITGPKIALNALKAFFSEAAIAAAVEVPIQMEVVRFKEEIGSPYSVKEGAFNVLAAAVGAGLIRSAGSVSIDVAGKMLGKYKADKVAGTVTPTKDTEKAAKVMGQFIREKQQQPWPDTDPLAGRDHDAAISKAADDINDNQAVDVRAIVGNRVSTLDPGQNIPGGRVLTVDDIETFDPRELAVDAEIFQFKAGGDASGVTSAFRDLGTFEVQRAGQVLVYEDAAGKLFIVDGHQRMGIARRALEAGQDPKTVGLFGFRLRASDGVTPETARSLAALKNIAEGSGSAIDAAKVVRELGEAGMARMPALPSSGAVVRQGRALANLDDEPFMAVVNGVIPERYGALVGEIISRDSRKQMAAIQVLARTDPTNEVQARQIVRDVNATELEDTTTLDLFGEQVVSESLILERAKVIDAAIKKIRAEKSTFKTLVSREGAIQGKGGNKLDRATNEGIVEENERIIQTLERQANTKGEISERLTEAARRLKAGESSEAVTKDFLASVGASITGRDNAGAVAGRAGPAEPEIAKPTLEEVLNGKAPEPLFGAIYRGNTPAGTDPLLRETDSINTKARRKLRNDLVETLVDNGAPVEGRAPVAYVMGGGGASGKGTLLKLLQELGIIPTKKVIHSDPDAVKLEIPEFKALVAKGDSRAAAVVHEESSDIAGMAISVGMNIRSDLIIDKTLGTPEKALNLIADLKKRGYEIKLYGVTTDPERALIRAWNRAIDTNRWVPEHSLITAHKGFASGWERYLEAVDEANLFDSSADGVFLHIVERKAGGAVEVLDKKSYDELAKRIETDERLAITNAKEKARAEYRPSADGKNTKTPSVIRRGQGEAQGAGVPDSGGVSGQRLSGTSAPAKAIPQTDPVSQARNDMDLFTEDQFLNDFADAEDILRAYDVDLPERVVVEDGIERVEMRPAQEILDDLNREDHALADLFGCNIGAANG